VPPDRDDCSRADLRASHRIVVYCPRGVNAPSFVSATVFRTGMVVECRINIWFCVSILPYLRMKRVRIILYNYFTLSANVRVEGPRCGERAKSTRNKNLYIVMCCRCANTDGTKTVCEWYRSFSAGRRIIIIFILIINLIRPVAYFQFFCGIGV